MVEKDAEDLDVKWSRTTDDLRGQGQSSQQPSHTSVDIKHTCLLCDCMQIPPLKESWCCAVIQDPLNNQQVSSAVPVIYICLCTSCGSAGVSAVLKQLTAALTVRKFIFLIQHAALNPKFRSPLIVTSNVCACVFSRVCEVLMGSLGKRERTQGLHYTV